MRRIEYGHSLVRSNQIRHIVVYDGRRGHKDKYFDASEARGLQNMAYPINILPRKAFIVNNNARRACEVEDNSRR